MPVTYFRVRAAIEHLNDTWFNLGLSGFSVGTMVRFSKTTTDFSGCEFTRRKLGQKSILLPSQTSGQQLYIFFLGPSPNQNNISLQF